MRIKRCPNCGGKAALYMDYNEKSNIYFYYVGCDDCGAAGESYASMRKGDMDAEKYVIWSWNKDGTSKTLCNKGIEALHSTTDGTSDSTSDGTQVIKE